MNGSMRIRGATLDRVNAPHDEEERAVVARGLTLRTRRGPVFEGIDLGLGQGDLGLLVGPSGSGKSALLLTLAARMSFTAGGATVCGLDLRRDARRIRRLVGLGIIPGVTDLDETVSIDAQVRAELTMHRLPHDRQAVHRLLEEFELDTHPHAEIGSLRKGEQMLLGIGLGLIHDPRVLMVDGADVNLSEEEKAAVWQTLRRITGRGVTVIASCVDEPDLAHADQVVELKAGGE